MESLIINGTEDTPSIEFDPSGNEFMISGRSLPEDAFHFYSPVHEWMKKYSGEPLPETTLKVSLDYFNSSSVKQLLMLFSAFENISRSGKAAKIIWYFPEGDDLMEIKGQEFQSMLNLPFELKGV